eukprot:gene4659-8232_t
MTLVKEEEYSQHTFESDYYFFSLEYDSKYPFNEKEFEKILKKKVEIYFGKFGKFVPKILLYKEKEKKMIISVLRKHAVQFRMMLTFNFDSKNSKDIDNIKIVNSSPYLYSLNRENREFLF